MLCNSKSGSANDSTQTLLLKTEAPVCLNCYCPISRQQKTQWVLQIHCLNGASTGEGTVRQLAGKEGRRWRLCSVGHGHHALMGRSDGLTRVPVLDTAWLEGCSASWPVIAAAACTSLCCTPQHAAGYICVCVEQCSTCGRRPTLHFRFLVEALQAGAWS